MAQNKRVTEDDVAKYIRARESNAPPPPQQQPETVLQNFVLYTSNRPGDRGTEKIMGIIDNFREDFRIVDVASLDNRPTWLNGTPIVVDLRETAKIAHRGSAAIELVEEVYGGGATCHPLDHETTLSA
jgi:hypothetical protein